MSQNPHNHKLLLTGLGIAVLLSFSFIFISKSVIANTFYTSTKLPTPSTIQFAPDREVPAGYVKGNYKAVAAKDSATPAPNELSLQEAAEIIAQDLFKFYNITLTNQTLVLGYTPKCDAEPSLWATYFKVNPDYTICIYIEAATGEIDTLMCQGHPNIKKLSASEDAETIKAGIAAQDKGLANPSEACTKVRTLLTEQNFLSEPVDNIKYNSSIYSTDCATSHPYAHLSHSFTVTTTSNKSYTVCTTDDLSTIITFVINR